MSYAPLGSELIVTNANLSPERSSFSKPLSKRARRLSDPPRISEPSRGAFRPDYPVIVHCHLCWDWVWQRPQQFLSRLSQKRKAVFVETIAPDSALVTPTARHRTP